MDIVYPIGKSNNDYRELRYSLRSLKYLNNVGKVWIIGEKPDWIQNVVHIPRTDDMGDKQLNVIEKIKLACQYKKLSDNFILMNDDFFYLEQTEVKNYICGQLKEKIEWYEEKYPYSIYTTALKNCRRILKTLGLEQKDYEIHYPIVINKEKWRELFHKLKITGSSTHRSLYGNYVNLEAEKTEDFKQYLHFKIPEREFLSIDPEIENQREYIDYIENKFPKKSEYEI